MLLLIKLFLAHLIGDFILQPTAWVRDKESKKWKSISLYSHVLIHGILTYLLVSLMPINYDYAFIPLFVMVTHLAIDLLKLYFQRVNSKKTWFFVDQFLHLISLIIIWLLATDLSVEWKNFPYERILIFGTAILILTKPAAILIKTTVSQWATQLEHAQDNQSGTSLANAGMYIGILERLFVFTFVMLGHLEAIGFLIAAKSLLRFGNLKQDHERKLTEYVLIGTLLSFGIAMVVGQLTKHLISAI